MGVMMIMYLVYHDVKVIWQNHTKRGSAEWPGLGKESTATYLQQPSDLPN